MENCPPDPSKARGVPKGDKGEDRRREPACFQDRSRPRRSGFRREEAGWVRPPSLAALSLPATLPRWRAGGSGWWEVKTFEGGAEMRVLGYGAEFAKVSEIEEVYNFFPELYSWGRHDAFFFRLRELREDTPISISQVSAIIPIIELRESEWRYEGPEWEFFPYREEVKSLLRFYVLRDFLGICFGLYRIYEEGNESKERDFVLEYRGKEEKDFKPLARIRLRDTDYVEMFENPVIEYFVRKAYTAGWRVRFI